MALAGSWSDVGGAHIQAFTFSSQDHGRLSGEHISKHSQKLSRSWSVVQGAVIYDVMYVILCDELCVVLFGVLRGGGVVLLCGCFISLFLFSLLPLSLLSSLLANKHCVKH